MTGWRVSRPLPPRLLLVLLPLLLPSTQACMETVLQNGTMADTELAVPELTVTSSCACCALCHHHASCSSLSFNSVSGACRLYTSVPDFSRVTVDTDSALFVRPGRSSHHQFCRHDSDCIDAGDTCNGRICTDDLTVTCRDLAETMGAPMNDVYFGSLDGVETKYYCASQSGIDGWTLMSRMTNSAGGWNYNQALERDPENPWAPSYSIIRRAEAQLRVAGTEPRFQIMVMYDGSSGFYGSLPVSQTLLPTTFTGSDPSVDFQGATPFGGHSTAKMMLPWVQPTRNALFSITGLQSSSIYWTIINVQGLVYNSGSTTKAEYFIRE